MSYYFYLYRLLPIIYIKYVDIYGQSSIQVIYRIKLYLHNSS